MPIDQRRRDANWSIYGEKEWNSAWSDSSYRAMSLAVLMDLRDELKRLNTLLHCSNFVGIPSTLRSIQRNTRQPKPKAVKVKP